ncbi:MAG: endonuclease III domain-containing protein [Gammaproteobacteria bacterium]|nr:endonuclease III domain-containing protein [Gammaproteobacteria bacterium]
MTLLEAYHRLDEAWGPQHWWPGESVLEIMVGAVLTQNTAWSNVERAIANLKAAGALSMQALLALPLDELAALIRPAGYFNVKARRLRALLEWVSAAGGVEALSGWTDEKLRSGLLGVHGVGPETADDILLYAFERPVFVIDAYTRRILGRLGLIDPTMGYEHLRAMIEAELSPDVPLFNQFHALLVAHGKAICRPRPRCTVCVLREGCPAATPTRLPPE